MKPNGYKTAGFTLIELLVVMAIIGILAALLMAVVSEAKARALRTQCASNLGQLGAALQEFVSDHGAYPLVVGTNFPYAEISDSQQWFDDLECGYVCPGGVDDHYLEKGVWRCPVYNPNPNQADWGLFSYGYNAYGLVSQTALLQPTGTASLGLGGHRTYRNTGTSVSLAEPAVRASEVVNPSDMMAIGDGFLCWNRVVGDGSDLFGRMVSSANGETTFTKRCYSRHQGRGDVAFCDGHVESPRLQFLFAEKSDEALSRWNRDDLPHRERLQ